MINADWERKARTALPLFGTILRVAGLAQLVELLRCPGGAFFKLRLKLAPPERLELISRVFW
ncbi:hypothetical protein G4Y73_01625 [Wenzhouxiangella sp. XN201]|nr:hypothetical protein [Wenzhouxiangella sp. XN201]